MQKRVAIVHDWMVAMRGGERVLESLCRIYPDAVVFTLRLDRARLSPMLAARDIRPSFLDRIARNLPLGAAEFRMLLPLFPLAVESLRLDDFDLVISSSHAVAKGALASPRAVHVSYVHSPMRYIWEARDAYPDSVPGGSLGRSAFELVAHYLRIWDTVSTARVDGLVANSSYTRTRIQRYYGRDSEVIAPPVDTERFARLPDPPPRDGEPLYLCVSALVPYKRVELAVRAFAGRKARLVVVGEGGDEQRLAAMASPNVAIRGRVTEDELDRLYGACHAVIHPALDDFGIVPVEAMAAGRPVVAFANGGTVDSVTDGETGVLFHEATADAVGAAITRLEQLSFAPDALRARARRFDRVEFETRFAKYVESCVERGGQAPRASTAPQSNADLSRANGPLDK